MEKAEVQTILELAKQMFMEDAPKAAAAAPEANTAKCPGNTVHRCPPDNGCAVPLLALYFVFSDCVVINNGACPQWDFCGNAVACARK